MQIFPEEKITFRNFGEHKMNFKSPFTLLVMFIMGWVLMVIASVLMLYHHEYSIGQVTFLIGIILVGISYAKFPNDQKPPINTDQVNKNIQSLNDLLWGKEKTPINPIKKCHLCNVEMEPDGQLLIPVLSTNAVRIYNRFKCPVCGYRRYG